MNYHDGPEVVPSETDGLQTAYDECLEAAPAEKIASPPEHEIPLNTMEEYKGEGEWQKAQDLRRQRMGGLTPRTFWIAIGVLVVVLIGAVGGGIGGGLADKKSTPAAAQTGSATQASTTANSASSSSPSSQPITASCRQRALSQ